MKLITVRVQSDDGLCFNWAFYTEEEAIHEAVTLLTKLAYGRDRKRGYTEYRVALADGHIEVKE